MSRIAIIGTGYVGLTTGACFAHLGHEVVCADVDPDKVAQLSRGEIPIVELGLDRLVEEGLRSGRLRFVLGAANAVPDCDIAFLCVPTPQGDDGSADLSYIEAAAREISEHLPFESVVVNKSTVPVGSARVVERVLDRPDVKVVSNPEFLREGSAVQDFLKPDRIVVGSTDQSAAIKVSSLYLGVGRTGDRHRSGVRRDDQVCGQRIPRDEVVVRQRGRRHLRRRRCRRQRCRPRPRLRQAHRPGFPSPGARMGWELLPERHAGAAEDRR